MSQPERAVKHFFPFLPAAALLLATGCMVGPRYKQPSAPTAPAFKEAPASTDTTNNDGWQPGHPSDQALKGDWWRMYQDPQLDSLEAQIDQANQTLQLAEANFRSARAAVRGARSQEAPTIGAGVSAGSVRESANQPYFLTNLANNGSGDFSLPIDLNYEIDLWSRVRRGVTYARAEAQASAADLENARLSLHAELAIDYFALRSADSQAKLLDSTIHAYEQALQLTQDRYNGGLAVTSDVTQAQTQLEQARTQRTEIQLTRARYEHAIAVLIGKPPASVSIASNPIDVQAPALPAIPGLVPSTLLERRPDIAAAERRMAAANEQIGIAKAAYYPTLSLSALIGMEGTSALNWFTWPSRLWAVGSTLSETVFDAGRRRAATETARAGYDGTIASYRQTTLSAFQQVEDNLAALRILKTESEQQQRATQSSLNSLQSFEDRYRGGLALYLEVVSAQTTALANQRMSIELENRQLDASVLLIKALGGGWDTQQLPIASASTSNHTTTSH